MERLFLVLISIITPLIFSIAQSDNDVFKTIILQEDRNGKIQRSLLPVAEVSLDRQMQYVEFVFNESVGNVNITIVNDMGQAIAGASCNTALESSKYVSVPTSAGGYTILISGDNYEAEGAYDIVEDYSDF